MTEHELQNVIRIALSNYGIVFRINSRKFYQGRKVFATEYKQYVLLNLRQVTGFPEGTPDLLFIGDDGKVAFIEVKTPTGKLSDAQKQFLKIMKEKGVSCGVARSVDDAIKIIKEEK